MPFRTRRAEREIDAGRALAELERAALPQPRIVKARAEHRIEIEIRDDQVLLEHAALDDRLALLVDDQAAPVVDDLVLPADQVHVANHREVVRGARAQHAPPLLRLAGVVGRGREVDHDLGTAAQHLLLHRAARIPDVLADVDPDHGSAAHEHGISRAGHEVTVLVEHAVVRQVALAVGADPVPVVDHRRGVVEVVVPLHRADDDGHPRGEGLELARDLDGALDERGLEEQVFGRIAGDHHLRKREDVDPERPRLLDAVGHPLRIADQISNGRVQLGEAEADLSHGRAIVGSRRRATQARPGSKDADSAPRPARRHETPVPTPLSGTNESARPWTGRSRSIRTSASAAQERNVFCGACAGSYASDPVGSGISRILALLPRDGLLNTLLRYGSSPFRHDWLRKSHTSKDHGARIA